jgi:hypothetical protein
MINIPGKVFRAILAYAVGDATKEKQPVSVTLENVMGLCTKNPVDDGLSNFDFCVHYLEECGYWVVCFRLTPQQFGFPVQRDRIYLLGLRADIVAASGLNPQQFTDLALDIMSRLVIGPEHARDLDDFLLPDDPPLIKDMVQKAAAKCSFDQARSHAAAANVLSRESSIGRGYKKAPKWPEAHAQKFDALGKDWWESSIPNQQTLDLFEGLKGLGDRHFDMLRMHNFQFPDRKRTIDVSQSAGRARPTKDDGSNIVTPTCQMYLGHRCRLAHGREALSLQGLHFGDRQSRLNAYSDKLLLDLGGNAFMSLCFGAVTVVKEMILGHCFTCAAARASIGAPNRSNLLKRGLSSSVLGEEFLDTQMVDSSSDHELGEEFSLNFGPE